MRRHSQGHPRPDGVPVTSTTLTRSTAPAPARAENYLLARAVGAALALGVAFIHVKDQGGFPGDKSPGYVGIGYYLLEMAGLMTATALLVAPVKHTIKAWLLAVGVALGPLVGFILSRGPGLPNYTDDKGNWTETLGLVSLAVEGALLVLAAFCLVRSRRKTEQV